LAVTWKTDLDQGLRLKEKSRLEAERSVRRRLQQFR
jgi:hypothetical protein